MTARDDRDQQDGAGDGSDHGQRCAHDCDALRQL
jgi:hypothetical protein